MAKSKSSAAMPAKADLHAFLARPKTRHTGTAAWNRWPKQLLLDIWATIEHNEANPDSRRGFAEFCRDWVKPTYGIEVTRVEIDRYLQVKLGRHSWTKS